MHLLREGQFSVASIFLADATSHPSQAEHPAGNSSSNEHANGDQGMNPLKSEVLRKQFADMHHILHALKNDKNLLPAIDWARENSRALETRGSNLEFELGKTQFVWLFTGGHHPNDPASLMRGRQQAYIYARQELANFQGRYLRELQQLTGAMAFSDNLKDSPYERTFLNNGQWDELANSFTREFCSLLGLSADSPLYIAATAGAIALPTLLKLQTIMKEKQTRWTTQHELPVSVHISSFGPNPPKLTRTGRNTASTCISISLHFCLSSLERTIDGRQSADDDALRPRRCPGIVGKAEQRNSIQVPLLPE